MKHVKLVGLCLVAASAFGVLGVPAAAQAETPEWGRCLHTVPSTGKEQKKGNYEDPNCTKVAEKEKKGHKEPDHKGGYEWYGGTAPICMKQTEGKYTYKEKECKTTDIKVKENKKTHEKTEEKKGKYALSTEVGLGPKFTAKGGKGDLEAYTRLCNGNYSEPKFREPNNCWEEEGWKPGQEEVEAVVECKAETATGEATGGNDVSNVNVKFTGCVLYETVPCTSAGAASGEIRTETLSGELGYIERATHKVGVLLRPAAGSPHPFAQFECAEINDGYKEFGAFVRVGVGSALQGYAWKPNESATDGGNDGIISPITPVDTMTSTFTQVYTSTTPGAASEATHNVPGHFEGGPFEGLESVLAGALEEPFDWFAWSKAAEEITNTNTVEGEVEIKA